MENDPRTRIRRKTLDQSVHSIIIELSYYTDVHVCNWCKLLITVVTHVALTLRVNMYERAACMAYAP